MGNSWLSN
jgi:hypothetical protein